MMLATAMLVTVGKEGTTELLHHFIVNRILEHHFHKLMAIRLLTQQALRHRRARRS